MGRHVTRELIKAMLARRIDPSRARVLVMGFAFKENCADTRNTRVADIVSELRAYSVDTDVYDPWVDAPAVHREYAITPVSAPEPGAYDAVIVAVAHSEFVQGGSEAVRALGKPGAVVYDIKGIFGKSGSDLRL